jgi:MFS family permease
MEGPAPRPSKALRFATLTTLYFAQGLPFGFFSLAVPVLLRRDGTPLDLVGLSSLLALPWGLKVLWAPLVERHFSTRIGRRKSWILPMQALTALTLVVIAWSPVSRTSLRPLLAGFVVVSALSATQDIGTDGLAIDLLSPEERGAANAIQVGAYRAGMIAGGGGILHLLSTLGFRSGFLLMAGLVAASSIPVLLLREAPPVEPAARAKANAAWWSPLASFFARPGAARVLSVLAVYKLGEALAAGMMKPFFVDAGFSDSDIALVRGLVGGLAAIVGAAAAGALMNGLGRRRALVTFALAQSVAIGAYAFVAAARPGRGAFVVAVVVEQAAFSAATTGLFTRMMDLCRDEHRATDYTAQASVIVFVTGLSMASSGFVAKLAGWPAFFAIAALLSTAGAFVVRAVWPASHHEASSPSAVDGSGP